jgi:glucosylceramidase
MGGHLNPSYYNDYAKYFVKWIKAFETHGIPVYSITPQNEPLNGINSASLLMGWDEERDFIKTALGPELQTAGLDVKIYVFDHNYNYDNIGDQQQYPLKIYADAEAAQYVAGAAYHNYGGSQDELNNIHNQRPDKELVFSEASIGEWHDGRNLSSNFVGSVEESLNLVNKWCKAVIVWNLMLEQPRSPNGACPTCYGAVDIAADYKTITRNCHYYEIGHLSQVVKPGAFRIKADGRMDDGLRYEAFRNADNTYALVVLNKTDAEKSFTVNDGARSFSYKLPAKAAASIKWK